MPCCGEYEPPSSAPSLLPLNPEPQQQGWFTGSDGQPLHLARSRAELVRTGAVLLVIILQILQVLKLYGVT
jgi:hypothetical protein